MVEWEMKQLNFLIGKRDFRFVVVVEATSQVLNIGPAELPWP